MRRLLTVFCLAGAFAMAPPGPASARPSASGPWTVVVKEQGSIVAGLRTTGVANLARAMRIWGPPSRLVRPGSGGCVAIWRTPSIRLDLANYGDTGGATPCTPRYGLIQVIRTTGPRWRTDRGLRIGQDSAGVVTAYPDAVNTTWVRRPAWLLVPYETICIGVCDDETITTSNVVALMSRGRVGQFLVGVGAAGE